ELEVRGDLHTKPSVASASAPVPPVRGASVRARSSTRRALRSRSGRGIASYTAPERPALPAVSPRRVRAKGFRDLGRRWPPRRGTSGARTRAALTPGVPRFARQLGRAGRYPRSFAPPASPLTHLRESRCSLTLPRSLSPQILAITYLGAVHRTPRRGAAHPAA